MKAEEGDADVHPPEEKVKRGEIATACVISTEFSWIESEAWPGVSHAGQAGVRQDKAVGEFGEAGAVVTKGSKEVPVNLHV